MAKKGVGNFTKQVTKELIKEQKQNQNQKEMAKLKKEEYINNRYKEAAIRTNNIDMYIEKLNNTINSSCKGMSIEEFIRKGIVELVLPKELLVPHTKPMDLNIRNANILEKIFKNLKQKYKLYVEESQEKYQREYKLYEENESKRQNNIEYLTKTHTMQTNEILNYKMELYKNRDAKTISTYKEEILNQIEYPFEFRRCINIGYCRDSKKLVIDYLLPDKQIVPKEKRYEYRKTKDELKAIYMNDKEINSIYNQVIFSIVLNSMNNIFKQDLNNNIDSIVFNGYIKDIDLATGQDISPYIISAMVEKAVFNSITMERIDKYKCLKDTMQGRIDISQNLCLNSIYPICKCDYLNKSVTIADSINLLEVDPFALEKLVAILFRNMGYEVIETKKTNDGGIDCELYNNDPIMGGKVIGQVKRYKNNIDIPKLREFESVLRNSNAMKGIFIATSNFSTQCEKFASDNNISLINGSLLVDYFNKYGINSYIQNK